METCEKILFCLLMLRIPYIQCIQFPLLTFFIIRLSMLKEKFCLCAGCKESQFYSLPFGQTVASMY